MTLVFRRFATSRDNGGFVVSPGDLLGPAEDQAGPIELVALADGGTALAFTRGNAGGLWLGETSLP